MKPASIAILEGTLDIHRPLFRSLSDAIDAPVHLISAKEPGVLCARLHELSHAAPVLVIPSDELTLNRLFETLQDDPLIASGRVIVPGSAHMEGTQPAIELTDKARLYTLLESWRFNTFSCVPTRVISFPNLAAARELLASFTLPVILKPARKDSLDSFTRAFPEKLAAISSMDQLEAYYAQHGTTFWDREFVVQEQASGVTLSWCGYFAGKQGFGFSITPLIKSPDSRLGGTTTLARLDPVGPQMARAVQELAEAMRLDGIFEIEFISGPQGLVFFYEINPRPWLQVSLLLDQEPNIFLEYLQQCGFSLRGSRALPRTREIWGSAARYLYLNRTEPRISLGALLRTLRYDVRLSGYFSGPERLGYLAQVGRSLASRAWRVLRGRTSA